MVDRGGELRGDPREGVWKPESRNGLGARRSSRGSGCSFRSSAGSATPGERLIEPAMASDRILELLRRPVDVDEYAEIRELWKTHSIAEDNRDLPGLISTLTEDCVYEVMGTGARAGRAMTERRALHRVAHGVPDIHFDLEYIVIGPQGVCEEACVSATHEAKWSRARADGRAARVAKRDLLSVGSGGEEVQGRDGLHGPRSSSASGRDSLEPRGAGRFRERD